MAKGKQIRSKAGLETDLTKDIHDRIVELIKSGNYPETAAAVAGIPRPTLLGWLTKGGQAREKLLAGKDITESEKKYVRLATDVGIAIATAEARMSMLIGKAGQGADGQPGDWRATAWILERFAKERWSQKHQLEHTGPNSGPITISLAGSIAKLYEDAKKAEQEK